MPQLDEDKRRRYIKRFFEGEVVELRTPEEIKDLSKRGIINSSEAEQRKEKYYERDDELNDIIWRIKEKGYETLEVENTEDKEQILYIDVFKIIKKDFDDIIKTNKDNLKW